MRQGKWPTTERLFAGKQLERGTSRAKRESGEAWRAADAGGSTMTEMCRQAACESGNR
jgi:hypothetical protein